MLQWNENSKKASQDLIGSRSMMTSVRVVDVEIISICQPKTHWLIRSAGYVTTLDYITRLFSFLLKVAFFLLVVVVVVVVGSVLH